jgi:hypothetical protein
MSALQYDSEQRLREYQQFRDEAKQCGKSGTAQKFSKMLEEERKILAMIKRVEVFNATNE